MSPRILIIGAGAAGLLAAGRAASLGHDTLVLEKMGQAGRKINISGKGRCNLTNSAPLSDFLTHFGPNGRFLRQAFGAFFSRDLCDLLMQHGVPVVTERGGRIFPASGKAPEVTKALLRWARAQGARFRYRTAVKHVCTDGGRITGVELESGEICQADAVILATGGASYPRTGSTGDGYSLCSAVGHGLVPIRPALVPLETGGPTTGRMAGLNLRNIHAGLYVDGKKRTEDFGELTFTDSGVSGPTVLTLSGLAVELLHSGGHRLELVLDLKPALDHAKLDARLQRDLQQRHKEPLHSILRGLLPQPLVPICLEQAGLDAEIPGGQVTAAVRKALRNWLKDFRLPLTGHGSLDEAIVTAGGIPLKEVDPRTMASRKIQGLYLTGELLDLQADTGGYNLQCAFSTGWLAGDSAARAVVAGNDRTP